MVPSGLVCLIYFELATSVFSVAETQLAARNTMPISGQQPSETMIENMLSHANPFHVRDEVSSPAAVAPRERDGITRRISAASSVQQRPMPLPPCCCWHCGSAPTRAQRARSDPSLPARAIVCRQVTTSDYITLIALGLVLPMAAVWMQNVSCCCALSTPDHASVSREAPDSDARTPLITSLLPLPPQLVDTWAKGTPIKRGDPRYFHVPEVIPADAQRLVRH